MPNTSDNHLGPASAQSRIIRVRDVRFCGLFTFVRSHFSLSLKLPIYYDTNIDGTRRSTSRIDDEQQNVSNNTNRNGWLYSTVSQTRQTVQQAWNDNKVRESFVRRNVFC
jgi:hypothetical protein